MRLLVMSNSKLMNMIFSKNELISMQIGTSGLPRAKSMKRSTFGVKRSKLKFMQHLNRL